MAIIFVFIGVFCPKDHWIVHVLSARIVIFQRISVEIPVRLCLSIDLRNMAVTLVLIF